MISFLAELAFVLRENPSRRWKIMLLVCLSFGIAAIVIAWLTLFLSGFLKPHLN